ncbi:MAG: hypothetical protein HQK53_17910 [Oligoflexia bacterium]|nr:hypothetical protein [Oligoflexia bacterium]
MILARASNFLTSIRIFSARSSSNFVNYDVHFVAPEFCTDNGAMIAHYAYKNRESAIPFPECLQIDAAAKYLLPQHLLPQR